MIEKLIAFSARNAFVVVLLVAGIVGGGYWAIKNTPIDAIPDLSDVQVIVTTNWEGRSPTLIEDQVTYPIVTALVSAPKVKVVRGFSYFDVSFIYVIFDDGTDLYWARSDMERNALAPVAGRRHPNPRSRRDRGRLGLPVRARRQVRPLRPGATPHAQ